MTTELDAVNTLLTTIGESPVSSLSSPIAPDATKALLVLTETRRVVLTTGWWFNTEYNYPLLPAPVTGRIELPITVLSVVAGRQATAVDPIVRGQTLYDRLSRGYRFNAGVTLHRVVLDLDWDLLPETAKVLITLKASNSLRTRAYVTSIGSAWNPIEEVRAYATLMSEHLRNSSTNLHNADGVYEINRNYANL